MVLFGRPGFQSDLWPAGGCLQSRQPDFGQRIRTFFHADRETEPGNFFRKGPSVRRTDPGSAYPDIAPV